MTAATHRYHILGHVLPVAPAGQNDSSTTEALNDLRRLTYVLGRSSVHVNDRKSFTDLSPHTLDSSEPPEFARRIPFLDMRPAPPDLTFPMESTCLSWINEDNLSVLLDKRQELKKRHENLADFEHKLGHGCPRGNCRFLSDPAPYQTVFILSTLFDDK